MGHADFTWFFVIFQHEFRKSNPIAFEVIMVLALDIGLDYFIRDIAAAAAEIATSPKMATPKSFAQSGEFVEQQI